MANTDSKKHTIAGTLVTKRLATSENNFTFKVTYVANWTINDICRFAVTCGKSKFTESELRAAYDILFTIAQEEVYSGSTVEFGFSKNSLEVDGTFIGPDAKFDPEYNHINLRCSPRAIFRQELNNINVIVSEVKEHLSVTPDATNELT